MAPASADRSEGDFWDVLFVCISDPKNIQVAKQMVPRGVGTMSTPVDFLAANFEIPCFLQMLEVGDSFWT